MVNLLTIIGVGFLLGVRHATDPDHVIAVSTIVSRQQNIRHAGLIGILWGIGHTITIVLVGTAIILFNLVIPPRIGWLLEWVSDLIGLACSLYLVWYGGKVAVASYQAGAMTIKTLVTPEWWLLAVLPVAFLLVAIEFVFRMQRLSKAERAPRTDAVSAS